MFAKSRLALLVGWVTGSVAFPLLAQDAQKTDTVVVTSQMQSAATKLETPDIETPQSVSIVTREQFEEQGATSVRQAVSYTPGVYSNQIGASNRFDYMVLRGFSDGSLDNVYLDGLKMMGDTNSHSSLVVDPWFLDSIEVVRGHKLNVSRSFAVRPPCSMAVHRRAGLWRLPPVSRRSIRAGRSSSSPGTIASVGRCSTSLARLMIMTAWRCASAG